MKPNDPPRRLWVRQVGWLVLLWTASIAVLAIVALIFRMLMNWAGMTA
jgi:hypothetical protein